MSLKLKMTLWYTVLMIVIVVAALCIMLYASDAVAENTAQNKLETALDRNITEIIFSRDKIESFGFHGFDDGVYLTIFDSSGGYLGGWDFLREEDQAPDFSANTFGSFVLDGSVFYYYDCYIPSITDNRDGSGEMSASSEMSASGEMSTAEDAASYDVDTASDITASGEMSISGVWVRGILPAESLENAVSSVVRVAFIALPFLVFLAALGGWLVAKYSLQPVRKITDLAKDISGGSDLSRRIEIGEGKDEIHTLADTFNNMFARLDQSFRAERQFTSDASHELRTPTAVILAECSTAEKMLDAQASAAELRPSIEVIGRQTRKMANLISRLLSFTRLTQGRQTPIRENSDVSSLTEAVCQEQASICGRGVEIVTDIEPEVYASVDESLYMSLVQNLVSNACKYGKDNGHVWVSLRKDGTQLRLSVKDDGIGMTAEQLPLIWNRFYQADPARTNQDGSLGLGLSMTQEIARQHGGDIRVESEPDKGSEFVFTMPASEKNP